MYGNGYGNTGGMILHTCGNVRRNGPATCPPNPASLLKNLSMAQQAITALERNIGIMARNNGVLASMLSQIAAGKAANDLRLLLQDTAHIARETGELLLSAQRDLSRAPSRHVLGDALNSCSHA